MDWKRIAHFLFFLIFPCAILIWFVYRAIWTLSALSFTGWRWSQNNIKIATQWNSQGTEWQEEYGTWVNGKPVKPVQDFLRGFRLIYLLPLILLSPAFYSGMFWGKNDPEKAN